MYFLVAQSLLYGWSIDIIESIVQSSPPILPEGPVYPFAVFHGGGLRIEIRFFSALHSHPRTLNF